MHDASQPNIEETTKAEQSVPFKSIAVPVFASRTVLGLVLSGKQSALHPSVPSECFSPYLMCDLFVKQPRGSLMHMHVNIHLKGSMYVCKPFVCVVMDMRILLNISLVNSWTSIVNTSLVQKCSWARDPDPNVAWDLSWSVSLACCCLVCQLHLVICMLGFSDVRGFSLTHDTGTCFSHQVARLPSFSSSRSHTVILQMSTETPFL